MSGKRKKKPEEVEKLLEDVKESEERFRMLVESTRDFFYEFDSNGRATYISPQAQDFIGFTTDELIGRSLDQFVSEEEIPEAREMFSRWMSGGEVAMHEMNVVHRDGTVLPIEVQSSPVIRNGKIAGIRGIARDILQRKRMEEELRRSQDIFRMFMDSATDLIILFDSDLNIIDINQKILEFLPNGKTLKNVIGKPITFLAPDLKKSGRYEGYQNVIESGQPLAYDDVMTHPKWGNRHFSVRAFKVGDGMGMIATDITEKKKAEEELRDSEEKWRSLTENSPDFILLLDTNLIVRFINYMLPGLEKEDFLGTPLYDHNRPEDRATVKKLLQKVLKKGGVENYEFEYKSPDGKPFFMEMRVAPRRLHDEIIGLTINAQDISKRKEAEGALRKSEKKYRDLVDTAIVGIIQTTLDGEILFVNRALASIAGFHTPEEMIAEGALPRYKYPRDREEWIEKLREDRRVDNFEAEFLKRGGGTGWGLMSSTLEGDVITTITVDITERKMVEDQLRKLSGHLRRVREDERTQIAREVHDELGQTLTALKMDMAWLKKRMDKGQRPIHKKINAMAKLVEREIEVVKELSARLRPGMLDDLGLAAAIEWQAEEFQKRTGIPCKLTIDPEDLVLDRDLSTAIFRIFQEALTNVTRHARATKVRASLKGESASVELIIEDNGVGIREDQMSEPQSFGIIGMRERVHSWGGEITIRGRHGKGTKVTVKVPVGRQGDTP